MWWTGLPISSISSMVMVRPMSRPRSRSSYTVLRSASTPGKSREGYRGGTWVLLDYGCIAIHVFNQEARAFYGLERLWQDGKSVDLSGVIDEHE